MYLTFNLVLKCHPESVVRVGPADTTKSLGVNNIICVGSNLTLHFSIEELDQSVQSTKIL